MTYDIEYSPEADEHLQWLSARQQKIVVDTVDRQLLYQPTLETRNRKPMRPNPVAPWELRLSGHFKTGQRWSGQNRPTDRARD